MSSEFIGAPNQITVRKSPHHLQITRTWFEMKHVLLLPLAIAWDAFIFWGYKMIFSAPKVDIFPVLFLLLPLSLGISLTYFALAGLLNKTTVDLTPNTTSIKDTPLPFWRNKQIASKDIFQLYCKKVKMRNGLYWIDIISVHAIMNNQNSIALLSSLKTTEQALFIKQEIENFLGIKNKSMKDELDNPGKLFF